MSIVKRFLAMCMALAACLAAAVCMAPRAAAGQRFTIAYTGGIGVYPRVAPSMAASHAGAALPEGASVDVECELEGRVVNNGVTPATNIWERLSDGTYLANAYINSGVDGWTPGVPKCADVSAQAQTETSARTESERPVDVAGYRIPDDGSLAFRLHDHYYDNTGAPVVVDWSFFTRHKNFIAKIKQLPVDKNKEVQYYSKIENDGVDMYFALGTFTVVKTSQNCYEVRDRYDFNWLYPKAKIDALAGAAAEFEIRASGCL
jgi:lipoprotein